ncbi:MAG: hypothetical protein PUE25_09355 [bacterium]|nr:hypothetical protein [bacterium]
MLIDDLRNGCGHENSEFSPFEQTFGKNNWKLPRHFPSTLPKGVHAAFSRQVLQAEQIIRESGFLFG